MARYVRLGPKARGFADAFAEFKIAGAQVKELVTTKQKNSPKIRAAIRGGHLETASKGDYENYLASLEPKKKEVKKKVEPAEPTLEEELEMKSKELLVEYYKDNYQVTEAEIETFEELKHGEMVAELLELESEKD